LGRRFMAALESGYCSVTRIKVNNCVIEKIFLCAISLTFCALLQLLSMFCHSIIIDFFQKSITFSERPCSITYKWALAFYTFRKGEENKGVPFLLTGTIFFE
jgi:hypothetical protein